MIAGIGIDAWKLPIFKEGLEAAGYSVENKGHWTHNTLILHVEYKDKADRRKLQKVIQRCDAKCRILKHG
jgi:hypothetical protein